MTERADQCHRLVDHRLVRTYATTITCLRTYVHPARINLCTCFPIFPIQVLSKLVPSHTPCWHLAASMGNLWAVNQHSDQLCTHPCSISAIHPYLPRTLISTHQQAHIIGCTTAISSGNSVSKWKYKERLRRLAFAMFPGLAGALVDRLNCVRRLHRC